MLEISASKWRKDERLLLELSKKVDLVEWGTHQKMREKVTNYTLKISHIR